MATTSFAEAKGEPLSFGEWVKCRRKELDLTQEELANRVACTVFTIRKIEAGTRRPSRQLVGLLMRSLEIATEEQAIFIKVARGDLSSERLQSISGLKRNGQGIEPAGSVSLVDLPFQHVPLVGREAELAALSDQLAEPHCRLLTITGLGGIGKTRLAIELASRQQAHFPGGVFFVSLSSISSPGYILPGIAEVLGLTFSGTADPQDQILTQLSGRTRQSLLLVLDNLEHLLDHPTRQDGHEATTTLLSKLLNKLPNMKILVTSRERSNLREEWVFELHGLPVPLDDRAEGLENSSAIALFLQCARRTVADFSLLPDERPALVKLCHLIEGTPLAIEMAAAWVELLSLEEIVQQILSNMDFLSNPLKNVPERHRSLRAVFDYSWNLLSEEERDVLCILSVFKGGFQLISAEQVAGASLPVLKALVSKSLLQRREKGRYDLHALIQEYVLEKFDRTGCREDASQKHLDHFLYMAHNAEKELRSGKLAEWLDRIEQEHNNLRAALEWAFHPEAPAELIEQGLDLVTSIDRFWAARGYIHEGLAWLERGLQACNSRSISRARALRTAGWLYNHGEDKHTAIALLQESAAISRELGEEICLANALDTLGDIGWRFGDFDQARDYYAESLEIHRKRGEPLPIGFSLISSGRLHVDYGHLQKAEELLTEGLSYLEKASDLRARAYCINSLGRVRLFQGELPEARKQFQEALHINFELGYKVDISEGLLELAVVEAILGDETRATLLWSAAVSIQKKIGFTFSPSDPINKYAPANWLIDAPASEAWSQGENLTLERSVEYALELGAD